MEVLTARLMLLIPQWRHDSPSTFPLLQWIGPRYEAGERKLFDSDGTFAGVDPEKGHGRIRRFGIDLDVLILLGKRTCPVLVEYPL